VGSCISGAGFAVTPRLYRRVVSKERAIEMRRGGKSRSQIAEILGVRSTSGALGRWLKGVPQPGWTKRPNAKDDLHAAAIELRLRGWTYSEIARELGVSKASLSLWLRDVLVDAGAMERLNVARTSGQKKGAAARRSMREAREAEVKSRAKAEMPSRRDSGLRAPADNVQATRADEASSSDG
jgi:transposase-like protein